MTVHEEYWGTLTAEGEKLHYHGRKRDWNPMPGYEDRVPDGPVVELLEESYGMVGTGKTLEEALQKLTLLCRFQVYAKQNKMEPSPETFAQFCKERDMYGD